MPPAAEFDRLRMVLVGTRNPLNLGAAARAMSNFGVRHLRVVNPFEPSFREARSAVGPAAEILARCDAFPSVADAVADCSLVVGTTAVQHRELQHSIHSLDTAGPLIRRQLDASNVAILFGSEKTGLANDDLSHCHWLLHIPTRGEHLSMNLGQAVAVTLYELTRETRRVAQSHSDPAADSGQLERITGVLLEGLQISGYISPETKAANEEKVRRLVRRLKLSAHDADVVLGMLRQIAWKLRSDRSSPGTGEKNCE